MVIIYDALCMSSLISLRWYVIYRIYHIITINQERILGSITSMLGWLGSFESIWAPNVTILQNFDNLATKSFRLICINSYMNIIVPSDDNLKWGKDRSQIRKFRATSPKKYTSQFQDSFHFQVRIISLRIITSQFACIL